MQRTAHEYEDLRSPTSEEFQKETLYAFGIQISAARPKKFNSDNSLALQRKNASLRSSQETTEKLNDRRPPGDEALNHLA